MDLAHDLIRLSGLEPDRDIPIVLTELEPGEKESEDILSAEEKSASTRHKKIYVVRAHSPMPPEPILLGAARLRELADQGSKGEIVRLLQQLVPSYRPSTVALSLDHVQLKRSGKAGGEKSDEK